MVPTARQRALTKRTHHGAYSTVCPSCFASDLTCFFSSGGDSLCFLGVFELRNHLVHIVAHNRALFGGFGANAELAILSAAKPKNSVSDGFEVGAGAR